MSVDTQSGDPEFSTWRRYLWPVHHYELKKLIPMLLIFFLISFNYNVLRTLKDTLLITAKSSGAEVIPFVKVWAMFPGSILMTLLYTWLSNRFSRERVSYIIISIFLIYFFIFTFVLYPIRDMIHPHATADALEAYLPLGFKGFIAMFRYWSFTLFYVGSELWGNIVMFVLVWGFANQVTKLGEAKRFYGLFGVGTNIAGVFAGQASIYCCLYTESGGTIPLGEDPWHQSLIMMVSLVLLAGLLSVFLFRWINAQVLKNECYQQEGSLGQKEEEVQEKLSLKQSFAILLRSKYLICIAVTVVAYNAGINLLEVMWKYQVKELYPNPKDFTLYMNEIVSIISIVATLSSLFVSGNAIRKRGWTFTAVLTPIILFVTSITFFAFFFLKNQSPALVFSLIGTSPLVAVVFFGSLQNILCRAAKYSVFDSTKEMAFVPLSSNSKIVSKAAIDGVCSRLGKSGGSMIHQSLLLFFATLTASAPYVLGVLLVILVVWVVAIRRIGHQFKELANQSETVPTSASSQLVPVRTAINLLQPSHALLKEQQAH